MKPKITFFKESKSDIALSRTEAKRILTGVMTDLGFAGFSINVIMLEDEDLRAMKKQYFNQDVYTDIISFTIEQEPPEGELYISPDRISQNAAIFGQPAKREFARILIHGACHLCGYNDSTEKEKEEMSALEDRFLTQYYDR